MLKKNGIPSYKKTYGVSGRELIEKLTRTEDEALTEEAKLFVRRLREYILEMAYSHAEEGELEKARERIAAVEGEQRGPSHQG